MMKNLFCGFLLCLSALFFSCKKDTVQADPATETPAPTPAPTPTAPAVGTGLIKIGFENMVDSLPLEFGKNYYNPAGDSFTVSKFKYYISNIVLVKDDNSTFTEPNSYHLIDHSAKTSTVISIQNIPAGNYKAVNFLIGVDSTRNCSGAQTGELDPAKGMFWAWNTGYIFFKLEGLSPQSGTPGQGLIYHIGGYDGQYKAQRNVSLNFNGAKIAVSATTQPMLTLKTNVNEVFKTPVLIDFSTQYNQTTTGAGAKLYADNYADMVSFKSIQN